MKRGDKDEGTEEKDLEGQSIEAGEYHVVAADHQWNEEVSGRRHKHGHGDPEDHDRSMVRD